MHCVMEVCTTQNRQFGCAVGHGPVCAEGQRTSGKSGCSKTVAASRSGSTVTSSPILSAPAHAVLAAMRCTPLTPATQAPCQAHLNRPSCMQGTALMLTM